MNHDYAHCLDYTKDCPKECFRAELQRDIEENRSEFIGVPLTYAHLGGTKECELAKDTDVPDRKVGKWIPVSEGLPEEGKQVLVCDDGGFIYTAESETRSDGELQWYESAEYRPTDDVVAWMPLPEPWKGEEDG